MRNNYSFSWLASENYGFIALEKKFDTIFSIFEVKIKFDKFFPSQNLLIRISFSSWF